MCGFAFVGYLYKVPFVGYLFQVPFVWHTNKKKVPFVWFASDSWVLQSICCFMPVKNIHWRTVTQSILQRYYHNFNRDAWLSLIVGCLFWKFDSFLFCFSSWLSFFFLCNGRTLLQEKELEDWNIFSCIWILPIGCLY